MELKRSLTKRMRARRSTAPDSIELPPRKSFTPSGEPSTPTSTSITPQTPHTPGAEEFVSIPFEGTSPASIPPDMVTPPRSVSLRSVRSSRSASVVSSNLGAGASSNNGAPVLFPVTSSASAASNVTPSSGLQPPLKLQSENSLDIRERMAGEPISPDSDSEQHHGADEMAQDILAKVHKGEKSNWSL